MQMNYIMRCYHLDILDCKYIILYIKLVIYRTVSNSFMPALPTYMDSLLAALLSEHMSIEACTL